MRILKRVSQLYFKTNAIDPDDIRRRNILNTLLIILFCTLPPTIVIISLNDFLLPELTHIELQNIIIAIIFTFISIIVTYSINKFSSGRIASIIFIIFLIIVCVVNDAPEEVVNGRSTIIFTFPIIAGSILIVSYGSFFVALGVIIVSSILALYYRIPLEIFPFILYLAMAGLSWFAASNLEQAIKRLRQTNLELDKRVEERTIELQKANERLKELSLRDPLTGLLNRRFIYDFYEKVAENFIKRIIMLENRQEKRNLDSRNKVMGMFILDMDNFKKINDSYGHEVGDKVLKDISGLLKSMVRSEDIIVRWGGEEFLIILKDTKSEYIPVFSKKIIKAVFDQKTYISKDRYINNTCSVGCAQYPLSLQNPKLVSFEKTIIICDLGLYSAKHQGKNMAIQLELHKNLKIDEITEQSFSSIFSHLEINERFFTVNKITLNK